MMKTFGQLASLGAKLAVAGLAGCELVTCLSAPKNLSEKLPPQEECEVTQAQFSDNATDAEVFANFLLACVQARHRAEKERAAKGKKGKKGYCGVTIEQDEALPPAAPSHRGKSSGSPRPASTESTPEPTVPPRARRGKGLTSETAASAAAEPADGRAAAVFGQPVSEIVPEQQMEPAQLEVLQKWTRPALDAAQVLVTNFSHAVAADECSLPQYKALVLAFPEELLAAFGIQATHVKTAARQKAPSKTLMQQLAQKLSEVCRAAQEVIPPQLHPSTSLALDALDLDDSDEDEEPVKKVAKSVEDPGVETYDAPEAHSGAEDGDAATEDVTNAAAAEAAATGAASSETAAPA